MAVPYESSGRQAQKARTRAALVAAARALLAQDAAVTVEAAAAAAGISRTTAYRYFANHRALIGAAHPEIDQTSLLPDDAPRDPVARLDQVMRTFTGLTLEWEPQLRASLRLSLESGADAGQPTLRQGRAIEWIHDALAPLAESRPDIGLRRLAVAIRSATGIESLIWLTDIAGLPRPDAADVLRRSAHALLQAAMHDPPEH